MVWFNRVAQRLYLCADDYLRMEYILYAFWMVFWLLNGLDKFLNAPVVDGPFGPRPLGWFGVNRDAKFIEYFSRLFLPAWLALGMLYAFAVLEIVIGITFAAMLFYRSISPMVHRVAFKSSILVFFAFSVGDILFGDRAELWEHGTFMLLTLFTYRMYLDRALEYAEVVGPEQFGAVDLDRDSRISTTEFDAFVRRLRDEHIVAEPSTSAREELRRENV